MLWLHEMAFYFEVAAFALVVAAVAGWLVMRRNGEKLGITTSSVRHLALRLVEIVATILVAPFVALAFLSMFPIVAAMPLFLQWHPDEHDGWPPDGDDLFRGAPAASLV